MQGHWTLASNVGRFVHMLWLGGLETFELLQLGVNTLADCNSLD